VNLWIPVVRDDVGVPAGIAFSGSHEHQLLADVVVGPGVVADVRDRRPVGRRRSRRWRGGPSRAWSRRACRRWGTD